MMKLKKIKKYGKYFAGLFAAGVLISLAVFPALGMKADAPRFNFLYGDKELFTGAKAGSEDWDDPIEVKAGESFVGRIYYHNGIVDSVAEDTKIKVTLPSALKTGNNVLNASISANNAETVTDTIIDDVVNGLSGLTLHTTQNLELDYVAGSVKWYPNARQTGAAEAPLLYGQTGSELFGANGLKIGDINGCWDYAGWVTFVARAKTVEAPELQIEKTVKNVSTGSDYAESVEADKSDKVNFKIEVKNAGNTDLDPVKVYDQLPAALAAVNGTGILSWHGVSSPFELAGLLGTSGVNIGVMHPGEIATLTFDSIPQITVSTNQTVINKAIVASGSMQREDCANVVLKAGNAKITQAKSAWNITQDVNAESVAAKPADLIEYALKTKNIGDADTGYVVKDNISDILEYADLHDGNGGSVNSNGMIVYPEANLVAGGELIRTFVVQVKDPIPTNSADGMHYDFRMENFYGNNVVVNIYKEVLKPALSISKYVRDVTTNESNFAKANVAYAGDTLEYKIVFKNSGNGSADYITISDLLPANVSLDTSSAAILGYNGEEKSISENMQTGFVLKTLAPGQEAYVRFKALINSGVASGEILKNTAYLIDNGKTISDTAETVMKERIVLTQASPVPTLPRTGAADTLVMALIAAILGTGGLVLAREVVKK